MKRSNVRIPAETRFRDLLMVAPNVEPRSLRQRMQSYAWLARHLSVLFSKGYEPQDRTTFVGSTKSILTSEDFGRLGVELQMLV